MSDIIFETERLYFRMPTIDDAQAMQDIKEANWIELQKWMNWSSDDQLSLDATRKFITQFVPTDAAEGGCIMFAFHKETDDLVMVGGYNATSIKDVYSTGYWGNVNYLGQGYATEKTKGILNYLFKEIGAEKVVINYFDDNHASRRVIEKCGFQFIKTIPKNHKCHLDGTMMDEHCYEIKADDWHGR